MRSQLSPPAPRGLTDRWWAQGRPPVFPPDWAPRLYTEEDTAAAGKAVSESLGRADSRSQTSFLPAPGDRLVSRCLQQSPVQRSTDHSGVLPPPVLCLRLRNSRQKSFMSWETDLYESLVSFQWTLISHAYLCSCRKGGHQLVPLLSRATGRSAGSTRPQRTEMGSGHSGR